MSRKKYWLIVILVLSIAVFSSSVFAQSTEDPFSTDLVVGGGNEASGSVIDEDTKLSVVGVDVVACFFDNFDICWWDDTVETGLNSPNINFTLDVGGSVTGVVTDESGNPIPDRIDVSACLYTDGSICWRTIVGPDGSYAIGGLPTGVYRVAAYQWPSGFWLSEFFEDTHDWNQAAKVEVTEGITTTDINFELELGGVIIGTVTAIDGEPLSGLWVDACTFGDSNFCNDPFWAMTETDGSYRLPLPEGSYWLRVESDGWKREYYDDTPYWDEATEVVVHSSETTTGIDFILEPGGTISGWVRDANGDPISDEIHVAACGYNDDSRCWWSMDQSDVDGSFTISGMATGEYRVRAYSFGDYWIDEFYSDTLDYDQATVVQVTEGITTTDINFELAYRRYIYLPLAMK